MLSNKVPPINRNNILERISSHTMDLPVELQQLVLENLRLPKPLFRPNYGKQFKTNYSGEGSLKEKYQLYWGRERSKEQNEAVLTVLNLARTSQYYANLLNPMIYETLVLRPTSASLTFVKGVQQSPKWGLVKHLIVCNVYREIDDPERERKEGAGEADLLNHRKQVDIEEGVILAQNLGRTSKLDAATRSLKDNLDKASQNLQGSSMVDSEMQDDGNRTGDPYDGFEYDPDPTDSIDFEALAAILEDLPPNLQKLTLDTPTDWFECFEGGEYLDVFVHETIAELIENEQKSVFRKQIYTIYKALGSQRNLESLRKSSATHGFEFEVLNLPPLSCSIYPGATEYPSARRPGQDTDSQANDDEDMEQQAEQNEDTKSKAEDSEDSQNSTGAEQLELLQAESNESSMRLAELLSLVTVFKISGIWWDNGAGWHMNTHVSIPSFAASMPTFFFNHLSDKCQVFTFEGDKSWVLGDFRSEYTSMNPLPLDTEGYTVASEYGPRNILLPGFSADACNNVKTVKVSNIIVGTEFLNFFKARAATIETLILRNCWIYNTQFPPDNDTQLRTWAAFLRALVKEVGNKLALVEISYDAEDTAQIREDKSRYEEDWASRDDLLSFSVRTDTMARGGRTRSSKSPKQDREKFLFGYGSISDKYGDLFPDDEAIEESVETGEDWKAWLELVDVVQKNRGSSSSV